MKNKKINFQKIKTRYSLVLIMIIFMGICSLANENFLTVNNLVNVLRQQSVIVIIALGEMLLVIGGMIDLSAGSVVALSGIMSITAYKAVPNLFIAFAVAIAVAMVCNLFNAMMVSFFKVPAFIATLASMTTARGLALWYTNGQNVYGLGDYVVIGQGDIFGIPIPIIIMLIVALIIHYLTIHTRLGRSIYAVGGNSNAAIASGINVKAVQIKTYLTHGVLVGIAAVVYMSRINGGLPNGGQGFEMDALTAAIIGGTSFTGGIGTALGAVIGAYVVGFLNNIMNLISVNSYVQQVVRGLIIAFAVIWDIYVKEKRSTRKLKIKKNK